MPKARKREETDSVLVAALAVLGVTPDEVWAWVDRDDHVAVVLRDSRKFKVAK